MTETAQPYMVNLADVDEALAIRIRCLELAAHVCQASGAHDPVTLAERMEKFILGVEGTAKK